jgi:hypothetical protein
MVGATGGRRCLMRLAKEGGPSTHRTEKEELVREEEKQLCHSVLHISQDQITGNY